MSALGRPSVLAGLLAGLALLVHPELGIASLLPWHDVLVAALALLSVLGLVARALAAAPGQRVPPGLVAAGAIALVVALGGDGARGRQGTIVLAPGQARAHFEESGRAGRSLGLRPFGFQVGVVRVSAGGEVLLGLQSSRETSEQWLRPGGALAFSGFRFAAPRARPTGEASRLRVALSDGAKTEVADVVPGRPARVGDVVLTLQEYFPDFALDDKRQPFSRSLEPRNPGALLGVQRGGASYDAFVLQSMPGVHRVEPLGLAFSLLEVEAEQSIEMTVRREPFAPLALAGALLVAAGLAWSLLRPGPSPPSGPACDAVLVAAAALVGALLIAGRGRVLAWAFLVPVPGGEAPLPGVGVVLGASLVAALAGTLLLLADAASGGTGAAALARPALWVAAASGALGCGLALVRTFALTSGLEPVSVAPTAGLGLAVALMALALRRPPGGACASPTALAALTLVLVVSAVASGVAGLETVGSYATAGTAAGASAALVGLCALEPAGAAGGRVLAFVLAVMTRLLRPL